MKTISRRKVLFTMVAVGMIAAAKTTGLADTVLTKLGPKQEWSRVVGYELEQDYTWSKYAFIKPDGSEFHYLHRKSGGDFRDNEAVMNTLDTAAEFTYQREQSHLARWNRKTPNRTVWVQE